MRTMLSKYVLLYKKNKILYIKDLYFCTQQKYRFYRMLKLTKKVVDREHKTDYISETIKYKQIPVLTY